MLLLQSAAKPNRRSHRGPGPKELPRRGVRPLVPFMLPLPQMVDLVSACMGVQ